MYHSDKNTDTSQSFQSWDSGVTRDLSPQRGYCDINTMDTDKDKDSMLDLASKVYIYVIVMLTINF